MRFGQTRLALVVQCIVGLGHRPVLEGVRIDVVHHLLVTLFGALDAGVAGMGRGDGEGCGHSGFAQQIPLGQSCVVVVPNAAVLVAGHRLNKVVVDLGRGCGLAEAIEVERLGLSHRPGL